MRTELIDLIRAIARSDWPTVDRLWPALDGPGGEEVLKAAFGIAANRRFEPENLVQVSSFVREMRSQYESEDNKISQTEAEAMIRVALGEADLAEEIDWAKSGVSTLVVILGKLLADANYSELDLERYLHEVEALAAQHVG